MINGKRVIAVIPARGGSKGLPKKNVKILCGKPLINWTIQIALKSKFIDALIVSTDDQEIADIAKDAGASVPFLRPAALAADTTPTIDVIEHVLEFFNKEATQSFDYFILLEPTSPLREDDDIDNMLIKLDANADKFDAIISVGEVGEHPSIMKKLIGDGIEPYCPDLQMALRRQDNAPAFFPYGVAYISKIETLLAERTFYPKRCTHYRIKRYQNYEIDDIYDFLAVESIMRHEWKLE
ncbi:MAG: acylneuraminate cytidylyltransferase [Verrucomicrobiaceae bacterium]|nr:acylneuraminate cytidylyltransferase [Verrucomicrobiaceae bacterium]